VQGALSRLGPNKPDFYDRLTRTTDLQQQLPGRSDWSGRACPTPAIRDDHPKPAFSVNIMNNAGRHFFICPS
jgi:hypothetical protein